MALEAKRIGRPYDLILMDVQMPELDGNAAAQQLRANGINSPIVAISAAAMEHNQRDSIESGCNDFLPKPVDLGQLVASVRRWCSGS
jgi:CheY-like chemotaxis protein